MRHDALRQWPKLEKALTLLATDAGLATPTKIDGISMAEADRAEKALNKLDASEFTTFVLGTEEDIEEMASRSTLMRAADGILRRAFSAME